MRQNLSWTLLLCASVCSMSCKGGESGNPGGPSAPPTPPSNPGTVVSQNGCSVTYACPNVDASGNANPSTPTFDRLTVSTGTSSSCRVDSYRNERPNPGDNIAIEFTIRNPAPSSAGAGYIWTATGSPPASMPCVMHLNGGRQGGQATTSGPFQALAGFGGNGGPGMPECPGGTSRSGDTFAQNLTLEIRRSTGDSNNQPLVAACGVTLWGYVTPNR